MERQSGSAPEQPAAKRARLMTVSVEDGDAGGGETSSPPAASPRSPKLRPAFLVVLFAVRMIVMNPVPTPPSITPSITQIEDTVQRIVNCAFDQFHEMVSSKLEKAFQAFQGQINSIHHEVRQMAFLCSNRHADQHTRLETNREDSTVNISNTNIRLRFLNEFKQPIYTDKNLIDKNNAAIKVAIFDGGLKITSAPLSKVKVEILVLRGEFCNNGRGNWTEEEFDNHIVQDEQGLLGTVRLTNGEVELSQIRFKKGTCMKNVIMAARVCKGENLALRVQEAIMKPVVVLDRRNEANEKRYPPSLDDDVFRLEEIVRNGQYSKRLLEAEIVTVQGFLKALNKDPNKLREILQMGTKNTSWSNLIGHARKCVLEDMPELKRYQSEDGNVVLFFNRVHDLVGAEFDCGYVGSGNFNRAQKALVNKRKGSAYDKLEGIASDYVVKGNVPKQISTRTDADAGPSVPVGSAQQPDFPAIHLTASHGTGAVENSPHGNINNMTTPIYPNANNDSMISLPGNNTNTNHYQDYGTAQLNQPPIILDSNMHDWQDDFDLENLMNSHIFEQTSIDEFQVPMQGEGACFCLWLMSHSRRVPSMGRDLVALGFQIQVTAMTASKHRPYVVQLPAPPWIRNQILVRY